MRILITRPEPDATALKAYLVAQGHEPLIEPLITVSYEDCDDIEIEGAQALIATSRNALRALAENYDLEEARKIPLFVVGPATAAVAAALGFDEVIKGPGRASELIEVIIHFADVNAGPLIYLSGTARAVDLPGELRAYGFHVLEPVIYQTVAAQFLSEPIVTRFRKGEIDAVLLLSAQTARNYVHLLKRHGLTELARPVHHICLSAAVAKEIQSLRPLQISTADRPNLQSLLRILPPG